MLTVSFPPGPEHAAGGERAALALGAEAVVLEGDQGGEGVAVVELDDVDLGAARCPAIFSAAGPAGAAPVTRPKSRARHRSWPGWRLGPAEDVDRRLGQVRGAARRVVTMIATPPLETRQQSSRWNGSTIQRRVLVVLDRDRVPHLRDRVERAHARWATAMCPSCSLVVPYRSMCRRAASAYIGLAPSDAAGAVRPRQPAGAAAPP